MHTLRSYPKIYNLGHPAIDSLFDDPVVVQEKIDGSQFSFGKVNGEVVCRSRGKQLAVDAPEKIFQPSVLTVMRSCGKLPEGYTFRGEAIARPKHNTITYDRVPLGNVVLFDVECAPNRFLPHSEIEDWAVLLGMEAVRQFHEGRVNNLDEFKALLTNESQLGGSKIEGIVFKSSTLFGRDGKALMGKYVSEAFKEAHHESWGRANPQKGDILQQVIEGLRTEARWRKAVERSRDAGTLTHEPRDIGPLIQAIQDDVCEEEAETIMRAFWMWAKPHVRRGSTAGFAEWYKELLAARQFDTESEREQTNDGETEGPY